MEDVQHALKKVLKYALDKNSSMGFVALIDWDVLKSFVIHLNFVQVRSITESNSFLVQLIIDVDSVKSLKSKAVNGAKYKPR